MASRIMLVGDSGDGKSSAAIIGMLKAGLEVFVADFDNAAENLRGGKLAKSMLTPEQRAKLHIEPLVDELRWNSPGAESVDRTLTVATPKVHKARAIERFLELQKDWDGAGPWTSWDGSRALIIDTGTEMSKALSRLHFKLNEKAVTALAMRDYIPIYAMEDTVINMLVGLKCWVVITYHLRHVNVMNFADKDEELAGPEKKKGEVSMFKSEARWPSTFGRKTGREEPIIKHFPFVLKCERTANRYEILTEPDDDTTFLRCPLDLPKKLAGIEAIQRIVKLQEEQP